MGERSSLSDALADEIKATLAKQGVGGVRRQMVRHFRVLRLMGGRGQWATPELAALGHELLPENLTLDCVNAFIDEVRQINGRNAYLADFADAMHRQCGREVMARISTIEARTMAEIVAFAMVLENLLVAIHNSAGFLGTLMDHWEREDKRLGMSRRQGPLFRLKFRSVRAPISKALEWIRLGQVPEDFCNFHLPSNILQAVAYDFFRGNRNNAAAGFELSRYRPGNRPEPETGAGPVRLSSCGQLTESGLPLSENWVDLYQSWNLAFGAQFASFPLFLCKLVIPRVAAYQGRSQQYVWDRTNALLIYLYFAGFSNYDRSRGKVVYSAYYESGWSAFSGTGLLQLWGRINKENAADYKERIRVARTMGSHEQ